MALQLSQTIQDQISSRTVKPVNILKINDVDFSDYLMSNSVSFDRGFGSASATFVLLNDAGQFSEQSQYQINVGDTVEFIQKYAGDSTEFRKFYGFVNQKPINKTSMSRTITLVCLDYISALQYLDIDYETEGTRVEIENEILIPNYLPAPNGDLAQLFDFSNDAIATNPLPLLMIKDRLHSTFDPQYDGFEIYYEVGQVKLGSPLNARNNYDLVAKTYNFYTEGKFVEDIIEELLCLPDGYGKYLFKETNVTDLVNNHLRDTYLNKEGSSVNVMTPNITTSTITIKTYTNGAVAAGATSITLDDVSGLPNSGSGTVNGNTITWTGISTNTLTGIPASGSNSLKAHPDNSVFKYEADYDPGQVWYLKYSNLTTNLVAGNFTLPSSSNIEYIDKRYGRIILDAPISIIEVVSCDVDYTFKTLQATGVELNQIAFRSRELANRFDALNKLRDYLAPNYLVHTLGDNKIWAEYLAQKFEYDYELTLIRSLNYLEDQDLYTRTLFYAQNKNPTNIVFNDGVDFSSSGETYKGFASQNNLQYNRTQGNYYIFQSTISNAGYIDGTNFTPIVYINNVAIDNAAHQLVGMPVSIAVTTDTQTKTGCHGVSSEQYVKIHTYYYYIVALPHTNIDPSQPIYLYDALGVLQVTISPGDPTMDYGRGQWIVAGEEQNSTIEGLSTASYTVFYSTGSLVIDYDTVEFGIATALIPDLNKAHVSATYEYWTIMIPIHDVASVIDGRWDSQVQIEFFAEPPSDYPLTILDLGAVYDIQALDVVAGFFKPDAIRKFDIQFNFTIQYSLDGEDFFEISDKTHNVQLSGGEAASFEESDLGVDFRARYLKILLNNVEEIQYGGGEWVVAFSEISVYGDIIIKSETTLIPSSAVSDSLGVSGGDTTIHVYSTYGFDEPESSEEHTAYIGGDEFTYTGLTSTSFTGCTIPSGTYENGTRVSKSLEDDTSIYDDGGLLEKQGDRLYKNTDVDPTTPYTQEQLNRVSRAFLQEFIKNHTKCETQIMFAPYLQVGQTIRILDFDNNITQNYFVESVSDNNGDYNIVVARYPS